MGRISMPQGRGNQIHNARAFEKVGKETPSHIDKARSSQNVVFYHKDLADAYEDIFGEYVAEYNAHQKRKDRKITNYLEKIKTSGNGEKPFYEDILQWGRMEDFKSEENRQKAKKALLEYCASFEKRNPKLRLLGAYIHMDEASPHLHLDYIPVADGFKTGMKVRNSLDRAMKQMGFEPKGAEGKGNNATMLWKDHERAYFGTLCEKQGLVVEAEEKGRGVNLMPKEYKEMKKELEAEVRTELRAELMGELQTEVQAELEEKEQKARKSYTEYTLKANAQMSYLNGCKKATENIDESTYKTVKPFMSKEEYYQVPKADFEALKSLSVSAKGEEAVKDYIEQEIARAEATVTHKNLREQLDDAISIARNLKKKLKEEKEKNEKLEEEKKSLKQQIADLNTNIRNLIDEAYEKMARKFKAAFRRMGLIEHFDEVEDLAWRLDPDDIRHDEIDYDDYER